MRKDIKKRVDKEISELIGTLAEDVESSIREAYLDFMGGLKEDLALDFAAAIFDKLKDLIRDELAEEVEMEVVDGSIQPYRGYSWAINTRKRIFEENKEAFSTLIPAQVMAENVVLVEENKKLRSLVEKNASFSGIWTG